MNWEFSCSLCSHFNALSSESIPVYTKIRIFISFDHSFAYYSSLHIFMSRALPRSLHILSPLNPSGWVSCLGDTELQSALSSRVVIFSGRDFYFLSGLYIFIEFTSADKVRECKPRSKLSFPRCCCFLPYICKMIWCFLTLLCVMWLLLIIPRAHYFSL